MLTTAEIIDRLKNAPPFDDHRNLHTSFFNEPPRPAAVLVPLTRPPYENSAWHVVFTRRTHTVADHKGQVAFPGGRAEDSDDFPVGTALREAQEEIGVSPSDVSLLGMMESLITISNYLVTPIIGAIPWNYPFNPHPDEVDRVFLVPLDWLSQSQNMEIRHRTLQFPAIEQPQVLRVVFFNEYDREIVWGVSAEITLRLLVKLRLVDSLT